MSELRKGSLGQLAMPAIVILVGLAAFGLGRLSAAGGTPTGTGQGAPAAHSYVGSKRGSVYYSSSCKGAQAIADTNKVWFGSAAEAQAAGYQPAANCLGL